MKFSLALLASVSYAVKVEEIETYDNYYTGGLCNDCWYSDEVYAQAVALADDLFEWADANGDGTVTYDEFWTAIDDAYYAGEVTDDEYWWAWETYDALDTAAYGWEGFLYHGEVVTAANQLIGEGDLTYIFYEDDASNSCGNEWIWSDWDNAWWRDACDGEAPTDCGWFYWDDSTDSEYWYTCDQYDEWNSQW